MNQKDFKHHVKSLSIEELQYILFRYCGPHNLLLRQKNFNSMKSSEIHKIVYDEIANRSIHELLLPINSD